MATRNVRKVCALHDSIASVYDSRYEGTFCQIHDAVTWHYLQEVIAVLDVRDAVIDVGAGTGYVSLDLLQRGFRDVTAVDVSEAMLGKLRRNAYGLCADAGDRLSLHARDFHDLSNFGDCSFAAAFCQGSALACTHDYAQVYTEMHRIVRPSGYINISVDNRLGSAAKVLRTGKPADLEQALATGSWHWYEGDRRMYDLHLFSEGDLMSLVSEHALEITRLVGKIVLPREALAGVEPQSPAFGVALQHCIRYATHPCLMWSSEYVDLTCRIP